MGSEVHWKAGRVNLRTVMLGTREVLAEYDHALESARTQHVLSSAIFALAARNKRADFLRVLGGERKSAYLEDEDLVYRDTMWPDVNRPYAAHASCPKFPYSHRTKRQVVFEYVHGLPPPTRALISGLLLILLSF